MPPNCSAFPGPLCRASSPSGKTAKDPPPYEGKICPKGQAGIETLYDPYRIRKVLKRKPGTRRGEGQWITVDFHQAIDEIVSGGDIFGEGRVAGLNEIYALRDRNIAKVVAQDIKRIQKKERTVASFQRKYAKHLNTLIDPEHPDLGPRNNQFVFLAGRIEYGRKEFAKKRFTQQSFGSVNEISHESICEWSHPIAFQQMTREWEKGKWSGGKHHMKPDFTAADFVVFFGTGFCDANFGPPLLSGLVSNAVVEHGLKIAVVDPRLSRSAGKADWWIPIKPGTDGAFALGMMRWMLDHEHFDRQFLQNANKGAVLATGESSWTTASYLVKIVDGRPQDYLRASEVGVGSKDEFVVSRDGRLFAVNPYETAKPLIGDLEGILDRPGLKARSAFSLLASRIQERSLQEYATICGIDPEIIDQIAEEFRSHGKRAAADFYRGAAQHTNGYYNGQAIITLNLLIGNPGWKGGLAQGGHWHEFGGKEGSVYDFKHPDKFSNFGHKICRDRR